MNNRFLVMFFSIIFVLGNAVIASPALADVGDSSMNCQFLSGDESVLELSDNPMLTISTDNSSFSEVLGTLTYSDKQSLVKFDCNDDTSMMYVTGTSLQTEGGKSKSYTTNSGVSFNAIIYPTTVAGIYFAVGVTYRSGNPCCDLWLPLNDNSKLAQLTPTSVNGYESFKPYIQIIKSGNISAVGDAHPLYSGVIGSFTLVNSDGRKSSINISVNPNTFTVKFSAPTCNLSVYPSTIDFGDVGNDKPRNTFTLKSSNCVNASGVTLKLTSTKAIYDNSNLSILANTLTGTSAAGGRGVAISWEDGSPRKYLSANDSNSSVTIDFGSIVSSQDIPMAALLTCTSASNNSTCDNYTPGAFQATGVISATYK